MAEIARTQINVLIAIAAILYVLLCLRVAIAVGKTGRSAWRWFFITLFLTAVPALVLFLRIKSARNAQGEGPTRCLHCGEVIPAGKADACPNCGMQISQEYYA